MLYDAYIKLPNWKLKVIDVLMKADLFVLLTCSLCAFGEHCSAPYSHDCNVCVAVT